MSTRRLFLRQTAAIGVAGLLAPTVATAEPPAAVALPSVDMELLRLRDEFLRNNAELDRLNHESELREAAYQQELARLGLGMMDDSKAGFPIAKRMGAYSDGKAAAAGGREFELVEAIMRAPAQSLAGLAVKAEVVRIAGIRRSEAIWTEAELDEMDWHDELVARFIMDAERLGDQHTTNPPRDVCRAIENGDAA